MAKILWALCCENAIVDMGTNNLSLINIVEQFNIPSVPIVVPQKYFVVSQWERESPKSEEENFQFKIIIRPESKKADADKEGIFVDAKIIAGKGRLRHLCSLKGIPIAETGTLLVNILVPTGKGTSENWNEVANIPIEINLRT